MIKIYLAIKNLILTTSVQTLETDLTTLIDPSRLVISGILAIILLLVLILKLKLHTVLSLLICSLFIGVSVGMPIDTLVSTVETGVGQTLESLVLLITLGAMFGGILEASGGAKSVAQTLISKLGEEKAGFTLGATGLIFGTIVFFEVGVMILIPLAFTLAKKTNKSTLYYVIPLLSGLASGFAFIPPSAGALIVTNILQVDLGIMILVGIFTGIISLISSGVIFSKYISNKIYTTVPNNILILNDNNKNDIDINNDNSNLPDYSLVIAIILIPLILVLFSTLTKYTTLFAPIEPLILFLGTPFIALLVTIIIAILFLCLKQGYTSDKIINILDNSLKPVAGILLVITGGNVISEILRVCGMGDIVVFTLESSELPLILLAFLIAGSIRICVGAAVVSMTMTAGIIASMPMIDMFSPLYLACIVIAINSGATAFSHFNDSGFWLASSLLEIDEKTTLKTWTVMETIIGFTGLCCALVISIFS